MKQRVTHFRISRYPPKDKGSEIPITIKDGEIIVLGGLQEVQVDSTESKYNLLSDIPYFGKSFSPENR